MLSKPLKRALVFIVLSFFIQKGFSQTDSAGPLRIAILTPLYLDSAFVDTTFTGGNVLPKATLPGLDFYNGVMLAVDSLEKENTPVEVWVYDTKKDGGNIELLKLDMEEKGFSLIISYITAAVEQQSLATFAFNKNIPFISATYPNDAGLTANPFFALVNPTLKTQVEGIYKYLQRTYIGDKVYYITRKGAMEQKIKGYFDGMKAKEYSLKYTPIELRDNFTAADLLPLIDTANGSTIICGSLNQSFGFNLLHILSAASLSRLSAVIGMPTWDGVSALADEECKNVNIVFSTPYNYNRADKIIATISRRYQSKFKGRPTDMVFKGFEQMYHFSHLLVKYRNNLLNNLSDNSYKISSEFNFEPVRTGATSYAPDYLENKKLYFVKMRNGRIKQAN